MDTVRIRYFSDILCVWAYIGQVRVDELVTNFPERVQIEGHFCPVFGDLVGKLGARWADRGGLAGYGAHVQALGKKYPHVAFHPALFEGKVPASSLSAHVFLCAIRLLEHEQGMMGTCQRAAWTVREAFFRDRADVSSRRVQLEIAEKLGLSPAAIEERIDNGAAQAELSRDYDLARELGVDLSPTLLMDEGRQRLNGNVGYLVIEANVKELLRERTTTQASWC